MVKALNGVSEEFVKTFQVGSEVLGGYRMLSKRFQGCFRGVSIQGFYDGPLRASGDFRGFMRTFKEVSRGFQKGFK